MDVNLPMDYFPDGKEPSHRHDMEKVKGYLKTLIQGELESLYTELQWLVNIQHAQDIVDGKPLTKFEFSFEKKAE